ncbi:hypothetical protein QVM52_28235, partial [Pseudomonas mosselii]|uniref:hypothetical protein n=1 Tax=Pseudomonas mosselii TaxID=78327 RepID=UPI001E58368E
RKGFFLVGIHAPLTHVMPEHKISDTFELPGSLCDPGNIELETSYLKNRKTLKGLAVRAQR